MITEMKNKSKNKSTKELAEEINCYHQQGKEREYEALHCYKLAGDAARKAVKKVGHGEWKDWVKENLTISEQMVGAYRRLSKHWKTVEPLIGKSIFSLRDADKFIRAENNPIPETLRDSDGKIFTARLAKILGRIFIFVEPRNEVDQRNCFFFKDKKVFARCASTLQNREAYNAIIEPCDIDVEGAFPAIRLLRFLKKLTNKKIEIKQKKNGKFIIRGKDGRANFVASIRRRAKELPADAMKQFAEMSKDISEPDDVATQSDVDEKEAKEVVEA